MIITEKKPPVYTHHHVWFASMHPYNLHLLRGQALVPVV